MDKLVVSAMPPTDMVRGQEGHVDTITWEREQSPGWPEGCTWGGEHSCANTNIKKSAAIEELIFISAQPISNADMDCWLAFVIDRRVEW